MHDGPAIVSSEAIVLDRVREFMPPVVRSPADQALHDLAGQPALLQAFFKSWHERLAAAVPHGPGRVVPIRWAALPSHAVGAGRPGATIALHRALQNEYCEWCVQRSPVSGKITRIDFTCESPEYWYTLWRVDPSTVLSLYRETLRQPDIQLEALCLKDGEGRVLDDPFTGGPQYDPLNAWNRGTEVTRTGGGAMHLSHAPNALKSAIAAVLGATGGRAPKPTAPDELRFERKPERHSDQHIRQVTGLMGGPGHKVGLSDPPGAYMQTPDFSDYQLPSGAPDGVRVADCWRITRGAAAIVDGQGQALPGQGILHAVFEVPADLGFCVGDITLHGAPIVQAEQVAATLSMQLNVRQIEPDAGGSAPARRAIRWPSWRALFAIAPERT